MLSSWEAANLKAISEHVLVKKMYLLEEYVVVLTFSPKDCAPEETEFFLSFSGYH